ncbi:MAG: hypothetical protein AAFY39_07305 [Pseudomonadota bacterium]
MIRALPLLTCLALSGPALAQGAAATCAAMERDGRLGPLTPAACRCHYAVAQDVLDPDIRALLFDSWLNGSDTAKQVEALKPRRRVQDQLENMLVTAKARCS